jgi:hypothetical protein
MIGIGIIVTPIIVIITGVRSVQVIKRIAVIMSYVRQFRVQTMQLRVKKVRSEAVTPI